MRLYLHETLGADVRIRQWNGARKLPYYLQEMFELHELQLREKEILLAGARNDRLPALSALRTQLDKLEQIAERPVVLVASTLASYERKRLVQQKVPFIVPGNQLYLPDLGIDFREYFRRPHIAVTAFTPATQAVFIAALLRKEWRGEWQPAEVIAVLGYTAMTLSRTVRELTVAGLLTVFQDGRARRIQIAHPPAQAWEHAKPFLRSPIRREVWIANEAQVKLTRPLLAGLSALALSSLLTEPPHPIYALSAAQWKAAQQGGVHVLREAQSQASRWQVWSYAPNLLKEGNTVDPLSLTLSLQDESDDRVQQALEELKGRFPW